MNKEQFHQYLKFPDQLNADTLVELEELVEEYPYFQAGRMLLVKNLKNLENIRFNRQLKYSAAFINNRQYLFAMLNGVKIADDGSFIPDEVFDKTEKDSTVFQDGILALRDEAGGVEISTSQDIDQGYNKSIYVQELEKFIPIADMDLLLFDHQVEDEDTLEFDFEGHLPELSEELPAEKGETKETKKVSSRDLIDEFIKANPRMPKPAVSGEAKGDISLESLTESEGFMTETLAEIYLRQGYYYKALNAYEKLSLKYPEKSIYFASQIQKIKELITNQ